MVLVEAQRAKADRQTVAGGIFLDRWSVVSLRLAHREERHEMSLSRESLAGHLLMHECILQNASRPRPRGTAVYTALRYRQRASPVNLDPGMNEILIQNSECH